jgi:hypothetical protein
MSLPPIAESGVFADDEHAKTRIIGAEKIPSPERLLNISFQSCFFVTVIARAANQAAHPQGLRVLTCRAVYC